MKRVWQSVIDPPGSFIGKHDLQEIIHGTTKKINKIQDYNVLNTSVAESISDPKASNGAHVLLMVCLKSMINAR